MACPRLYWANHRLEGARRRLERLGPLSQLRQHGRHTKATAIDDIDRFTQDVRQAEAKVADSQCRIEELGPEVERRATWDAENNWPDARLRSVEAELADLHEPARTPQVSREHHVLRRANRQHGFGSGRGAEAAPPPLPGPDLGLDLGP